ncbi:T-complex protein 11-like protein 2 isoform X2 [Hypomesus transpacificus]|nr:T-complex protein 11-like protein 2 isoform X2 [Hypomesus transpacificus]XP_046878682.1 T-complex protein 11-like protein 2 isoform X2 [Hypomesus transpacificus]XP_046878683.1 T-complex protein 11-like protein 2 isoform X2 [Hypomesus transpacificus]
MPLNDERPTSTSAAASEDQGSDGESMLSRCDSTNSASDLDYSRQSFTSDCSSKQSSPSSSPPKTITLDEVMTTARDLSNLNLAHEIIVNHSFQVEQPNLPENSLEKRVRDMVHKAFWDSLEAELNDEPAEYEHAIKLLEEIREILLSFLNPGANRLRTQILEVLDMDLIRQQADKEVVDIQGLASYIISIMGKLCAPIRDDEIKKFQEGSCNIVQMFKDIFRVLDLMKMDMVNFTIQNLRPELQKQSVEFERAKFQTILDKTPSALDHTTSWIKSALEELMLSMPPTAQTSSQGKGGNALPGPLLVINTGFIHILFWNHQKSPLPETLVTDEVRLRELQRRLQLLQTVASVLLIVYSAVGGAVSGLPALADRLKRMTSILLEGMHSLHFNLEEALEGVSRQICCELNKSLTKRNYLALPVALQATLKGQICALTQESNPIRTLVEGRVQEYLQVFLSTPNSNVNPPSVPTGLSAVEPEFTALGVSFVCLVNYNKQVYGPFYTGILKSLLFSKTSPHPSFSSGPPSDPPVTSS